MFHPRRFVSGKKRRTDLSTTEEEEGGTLLSPEVAAERISQSIDRKIERDRVRRLGHGAAGLDLDLANLEIGKSTKVEMLLLL